jgi:hypothetical protein
MGEHGEPRVCEPFGECVPSVTLLAQPLSRRRGDETFGADTLDPGVAVQGQDPGQRPGPSCREHEPGPGRWAETRLPQQFCDVHTVVPPLANGPRYGRRGCEHTQQRGQFAGETLPRAPGRGPVLVAADRGGTGQPFTAPAESPCTR